MQSSTSPNVLKLGPDFSEALRQTIRSQLFQQYGFQDPDQLAHFIFQLVRQKKKQKEVATELSPHLGEDRATAYCKWLWSHLTAIHHSQNAAQSQPPSVSVADTPSTPSTLAQDKLATLNLNSPPAFGAMSALPAPGAPAAPPLPLPQATAPIPPPPPLPLHLRHPVLPLPDNVLDPILNEFAAFAHMEPVASHLTSIPSDDDLTMASPSSSIQPLLPLSTPAPAHVLSSFSYPDQTPKHEVRSRSNSFETEEEHRRITQRSAMEEYNRKEREKQKQMEEERAMRRERERQSELEMSQQRMSRPMKEDPDPEEAAMRAKLLRSREQRELQELVEIVDLDADDEVTEVTEHQVTDRNDQQFLRASGSSSSSSSSSSSHHSSRRASNPSPSNHHHIFTPHPSASSSSSSSQRKRRVVVVDEAADWEIALMQEREADIEAVLEQEARERADRKVQEMRERGQHKQPKRYIVSSASSRNSQEMDIELHADYGHSTAANVEEVQVYHSGAHYKKEEEQEQEEDYGFREEISPASGSGSGSSYGSNGAHHSHSHHNGHRGHFQLKRCFQWPNCPFKSSCKYHHPTETCRDFLAGNCNRGDQFCLYIHPALACKQGVHCDNQHCPYSHPSPAALMLQSH